MNSTNSSARLVANLRGLSLSPSGYAITLMIDLLLAGLNSVSSARNSDQIQVGLQAINATLNRIDQALVDGFGGLDPAIERLRDQRSGLLEEQARVFSEMRNIIEAQGITNPEVVEQLHMPDRLRTYGEAMPLWEHSDRLVSVMEQLVQVQRDMEARRAELAQGISPVSGVGAGAVGGGAAGAPAAIERPLLRA